MPSSQRVTELMLKFLKGEINAEEELELLNWRNERPENEKLFQEVNDPEQLNAMMEEYFESRDEIWRRIVERAPELKSAGMPGRSGFKFLFIVVSLVFVISAIYMVTRRSAGQKASSVPIYATVTDIPPGSDKAILTLSNGTRVVLDKASIGKITNQGGAQISKKDSGTVFYSYSSASDSVEIKPEMNTLTTPRAGQYHLVLADGTHVWLNAQSSLTYPVSFNGTSRNVELEGEAYFEVAKNPLKPFLVHINHQAEVRVLGTKFNVKAYPEESVLRTSLLEGSVKLTEGESYLILKPGEEAESGPATAALRLVDSGDPGRAIEWTKGKIPFTDADVQTIMRALARWYDVDIVYKGAVPKRKLVGGIERNTNLSDVLKVLDAYGIRTRLDGRHLIVL